MKKDKNSKYWGYMEQNEAVKDTIQPDIGVGKEIILLIYEHNVSQSSCLKWPAPSQISRRLFLFGLDVSP